MPGHRDRTMSEKNYIGDLNWELLTKYLVGEANAREKSEVENWLEQSDDNKEEMERCRKVLMETDANFKAKQFDSNAAWKSVKSKMSPTQLEVVQRKTNRKEQFAQFYKYAAILIVAVLLGSIGYYFGFKNQSVRVTELVTAEKPVLNDYVLPDGSVVTLNSNSKLEFPEKFASDTREVTIIGEAFFDVKPNPEKPFIINAGGTQVKVLGTSFNVSAYPATEAVEVIVKTGKVQVIQKTEQLQAETNEVILTPGEKGTFYSGSQTLEKSVNRDVNFMAWKTNDIIFNETPLGEVIECLEKVYHIEIDLTDPVLEDLVLTAHFDKKPIDFVLNVVRLTFNLELSGENEHFTLKSRTNE